MKRFTKFVVESIEEADLNEAVEVRHDRYLRSHGKKARDTIGGSGTWAFTHKDRGDVDYNNDKEIYKHSGKFSDAKKAAQQWGKKHGHREVYVMESVELDEVSDKMLDRYRQKAFADQPAGDDGSDKYRKRKFGRDLAFAKQTGRAKVLATKEEVELDEGKKKGLWDNIHARRKKGLPPKKPGEEGYPKTLDIGENTNEEIDYKVSVDGLPDMYIKAKSPAEIKTKLRKIVKKPDTIQSVERVTKSMLNKIFRDKAMGKEEPNDTEE